MQREMWREGKHGAGGKGASNRDQKRWRGGTINGKANGGEE